jgi:hypothetical protein
MLSGLPAFLTSGRKIGLTRSRRSMLETLVRT